MSRSNQFPKNFQTIVDEIKIDNQFKLIELTNSNKEIHILDVQITFCNLFVLFGAVKNQSNDETLIVQNLKTREEEIVEWKVIENPMEIKKILRMQTHMNYGLLLLIEKRNGRFAIYYIDEELMKFVELCEIELENVKDFAISTFQVNGLIGLLVNQKNELFKFSILDQNVQNIEKLTIETSATICSLNSGAYHFTILDQDGSVFCFGNNSYMQCGISHETYDDKIDFPRFIEERPLPLEILRGDVQIRKTCCGASHTLLLSQDNCLYVMGSNNENQCGFIGEEKFLPGPVLLESNEEEALEERILDACCGPNYSVILVEGMKDETFNHILVSGKRLGFNKLDKFKKLKTTNATRIYCSSMGSFIVTC
ncbi:predicted protein [Naegleria gruberi]|uniref:Predicted protein n=1 Tax=Naegleria gruberi TaxID=5762 RepID=D2V5Y6_NAEGR|nr:uncharacterized protein NAEGRDRAFT_46934 [Naegleria gruberi]EFC47730.1 predicted protein [Naegleria gruberi]|eukprot:XP_002680474.1 predicted protein [Naegleria gruberi strain NEG-M]